MTRPNTSNAPPRSADAPKLNRWALVCFFVLTAIIGLRPLIQETHDTERMPFASMLAELPDIGPLPTLWINVVIIGVFGWTMALRFQGRLPKPRRKGLMLGFLMVVIAAGASCFVASNKRLAINTTLDWITLPMLAIALAHLLQHAWQSRLVLCVVVASGVASAIESFDQAFVTLPLTIEQYEQGKDKHWREQGVAPDSYQITLYEKRVYEQAANGYFAMANIAGSYFVLTIFAALALAVWRWPDRVNALLQGLMALPLIGALWYSKSRGAIAALIVGLFAVFLLHVVRHAVARSRRRAFFIGWAVVVGGLGCVGAYGLVKGSLPGGSLTYRWWYLETTAKMVADHPAFGVGSGQYGRFYPRYKEIKSPEEIVNPHNFLAHAAAEWGVGGLAGMILMLVGGSRVVAGVRNAECGMRNGEASSAPPHRGSDIPRPMLWAAVLFSAIWMLQIWIVGRDLNFIYAQLTLPMLGWLAAFALCATMGIESGKPITPGPSPIPPAGILAVGLFAFLVHNLVTFSLFIPGAATTFFALLGVCIAMRSDKAGETKSEPAAASRRPCGPRPWLAATAIASTLACVTIVYVFEIRPVSTCWEHLTTARTLVGRDVEKSRQHFELALQADHLDPTPMREWVQLLALAPHPELGFVDHMSRVPPGARNGLRARDPESISAFRVSIAALMAELALHPERVEILDKVVGYHEHILRLYPTNPINHVRMSNILAMQHEQTADARLLRRAANELAIALDLNSQRDPFEVRRFSTEKVAELQSRLAELKGMLEDVESREAKPEDP